MKAGKEHADWSYWGSTATCAEGAIGRFGELLGTHEMPPASLY